MRIEKEGRRREFIDYALTLCEEELSNLRSMQIV